MQNQHWNDTIAHLPGAHILQTAEWGMFKAGYGWQPHHQLWHDRAGNVCGAGLVLERPIPGGFSMLYAPRGPLVDWTNPAAVTAVLDGLHALAVARRAIFVKMDPEIITGREDLQTPQPPEPAIARALEEIQRRGWRFSPQPVQFRNTVWLDLSGTEDDWLARMKQKTRYNLRLAQRKGVTVRSGTELDLPLLYRMYAETSLRDGFVIRPEAYYTTLWRQFMARGMAQPLIAEVEGQPVAAIVLFFFAGRVWYLHGMSVQAHREKMPNYLLQWQAMRLARERGCSIYDLWGAPDSWDEHDPLWGVYRFKEGLGGQTIRTAGAWDYPLRPLLYRLYTNLLPRVLDVMRRSGRARTQREVGA